MYVFSKKIKDFSQSRQPVISELENSVIIISVKESLLRDIKDTGCTISLLLRCQQNT